jgi:TonB family protein
MALCLIGAAADYHQLESDAEKAASRSSFAEAQTLYESALQSATDTHGPRHPDVARLLTRIALMTERQSDASSTEALYRKAIAILEASTVNEQADLAVALDQYAGFLTKRGMLTVAEPLRERAGSIHSRLASELAAKLPTSADSDAPIPIGSGVTPPVPISKREPSYTFLARIARIQGSVSLSLVVGRDGSLREVRLVRGLGYGLDERAVESILKWKFRPAIKDGQPVSVTVNVEMNFRSL